MQDNERDEEGLPQRESWQLEDEEKDIDETITIDPNPDGVISENEEFTTDPEVLEDFADRQGLNTGSDQLLKKLSDHSSMNPGLSAEDIDAAWESADVSGEESAGGTVATPDQDIVEEIGAALGLEYEDDELLQTEDKLDQRDQDRWELDPASSDDELDEEEAFEDDLDPLSSDLEDAFSEVEGEVSTNRFVSAGLYEDWEGFYSGGDEGDNYEEFEDELDEDFFEQLDEDEDK